jgi:hypothetical protein
MDSCQWYPDPWLRLECKYCIVSSNSADCCSYAHSAAQQLLAVLRCAPLCCIVVEMCTHTVAPQLLLLLLLVLVLLQQRSSITDKHVLISLCCHTALQGVFIAICVIKLLTMAGKWCTVLEFECVYIHVYMHLCMIAMLRRMLAVCSHCIIMRCNTEPRGDLIIVCSTTVHCQRYTYCSRSLVWQHVY